MPQPVKSIANMREMFRPTTDKMPSDLRRALSLLDLTSITDLEERILATTAFLMPWSIYRDSCLLVNNYHTRNPSAITRLDILWFYTQFDESMRRHDPRAETSGTSFHIDKSKWRPVDHEKHLYAWLLQTFCVGKSYSPFGFQYFELRNVCTAWDEVFIPIIQAVCSSYSVKGRRHYGRLALFIEERCPSRLAFPEGNINIPEGVMNSPTPFRMVSRPAHVRGASQTVLTKRNYDEAEKELREVYPQYGGLVERPRFEQKMEDWLDLQRARAENRKTVTKAQAVQYVPKYQPQIVQQTNQHLQAVSPTKTPSENSGNRSPIKRYTESILKSLSTNIGRDHVSKLKPEYSLSPARPKTPATPTVPMIPYGGSSYVPKISKQESKSPLHGVTRKLDFPDDVPDSTDQDSQEAPAASQFATDNEDAWPLPASRPARPRLPMQRPVDIVHSTVRRSLSLTPAEPEGVMKDLNVENIFWSPIGAPSAIPPPLQKSITIHDEFVPQFKRGMNDSSARHPSYEGNGYEAEISLTNLHTRAVSIGSHPSSSSAVSPKSRSRLPAPIKVPPPYVSQLHVESNNTHRQNFTSEPATDVPKPIPWPGSGDPESGPSDTIAASAPPIPPKSSVRQQKFEKAVNPPSTSRIISKENIRAALGNLTPKNSVEDLRSMATEKVLSREAGPHRLEAYNTHMFPRNTSR